MNPVRPFSTKMIIDKIEGCVQQLMVRSNGVNPVRPKNSNGAIGGLTG